MVTVVDPSDPGSPDQTSYGNAGSISSSSVMPTALPGVIKQVPKMLADPTGPLAIQWRYLPRLLPFLASFLRYSSRANVEASGRAIAALIHRVSDAYAILLEETGTQEMVKPNGSLKVYKSDQSFGEAVDIRFQDRKPRTVVTTAGDQECDLIVLAAGAWSRNLAAKLGARVLLEAERGYHIMLPKPPVMPNRFITFMDRKFATLPHEDGLRVTTGIEYAKVDAPPDYRRIRSMLPFAQESIRDLDMTEQSIWLGRRPTLPNSVPVISRSPRHDNVLLAFGHSHLGLTMGPATGQIIADLAAGRDPDIDLTPYRPDR